MHGSDMRYEAHGDGDEHELPVEETSQELLGDEVGHELPVEERSQELLA
jgi:hypothetical protein